MILYIYCVRDLKYLAAYTIPLACVISFMSNGVLTYSAVLYAFVVIPLMELIVGEDGANLTDEDIKNRGVNKLFDLMLYVNVPIVYAMVFWGIYVVTNNSYTVFETVGITLSGGVVLATNAINVAHELGHRSSVFEKTLSKILLLPCLYMHFFIEHNFGHHTNVGTPKDGASARYKQSVYAFWISSVTKQYIDAWKKQNALLKRSKSVFYSIKNDMLWYLLIQSAYLSIVWYFFGYGALIFCVSIGIISFLFLETINYIEHYGLRRVKTESGRYERVQTCHSWNSNHSIGRIVLYELTRHSDHHYKSSKKYQILDCYDESPQLPYGYPTSILLSLVPPLWFKIMNKRVPERMKKINY